jgi:hypothetical protein
MKGAPSGKRIKSKKGQSDGPHYAALAEHGRIHKRFDMLESDLGKKGTPANTTKLGELEDGAAKSIPKATGCDEKKVKQQLRDHHQKKGLGPDTKVRADPFGKRADPPPDGTGTAMENVAMF